MKLTERRKSDRQKMADILVKAMREAGAEAEIVESCGTREIDIEIKAPGGAAIHVDFDGDSCQPDVHVATWNRRFDGRTFFNPDIGDVNHCHYGKASRVCYGFEALLAVLKRDVARFVDGSGYMKPDDPRIAEMREGYRARGWRWPGEAPGKDES